MAYDERVAERIRADLSSRGEPFEERKMFGGLCFMIAGHMCAGVMGEELLARTGADAHARSLRRPHTRVMDFTGRPMKGFVLVGAAGLRAERSLRYWLNLGVGYARTLPPRPVSAKTAGAKRRRTGF